MRYRACQINFIALKVTDILLIVPKKFFYIKTVRLRIHSRERLRDRLRYRLLNPDCQKNFTSH
jgi:hypothetical protein